MKFCLQITVALLSLFNSSLSIGQNNFSLGNKAKLFIEHLKNNRDYPFIGKDTLIDLNGDGFRDILIEFYGMSGTGEKNGVRVYLYSNSIKNFKHCEQLDYLANPTFYFDQKIVVGYYLGNGGGHATKLKWIKLRLDTLENIDIEVIRQDTQIKFRLESYNYINKKKWSKVLSLMDLPVEYRYMEYEPIIKRQDD